MSDRALALLEMALELHRRGYQRLRLLPYMAASGLYWRLELTAPGTDDRLLCSTADEPPTAEEVLAAHPALAEAGRGEDPAYTAWVSRVVDLARQGRVAYFFADWETGDINGVPLLGPEEGRPHLDEPPGGR